jgi:flagellar hook-basal body complex protein FliE
MPIDAVSTPLPLARPSGAVTKPAAAGGTTGAAASAAAGSFGDSLAGLLTSVDQTAGDANSAIANMVRGTGDVHEAMIALQRAETTLQLTVQVRNKLVQAYQDIMRMPI